jgi:hypothetical protein
MQLRLRVNDPARDRISPVAPEFYTAGQGTTGTAANDMLVYCHWEFDEAVRSVGFK